MDFFRSSIEGKLYQSVETTMDGLFSYLEGIQEDDELARALTMSLGCSESNIKGVETDHGLAAKEIDGLTSSC